MTEDTTPAVPSYDELDAEGKARRDLLSAVEMLQDMVPYDHEPWTFEKWKELYDASPHTVHGLEDVAKAVYSAFHNLQGTPKDDDGDAILLDGPFDPL